MGGAWLFLVAYACSGLAGLIYEVSWTRLATLYMGHTTAAASTVVAAFMGGLAGGSAMGGAIAARLRPKQALLVYAGLEAAVILIALAVPWELRALTSLFKSSYADGNPGMLFVTVRLIASLFLFAIPSFAIGATFPMAVRWFVTRPQAVGRLAGGLYAANTIGAAVGSFAAGFLLLPAIGLFDTVLVGIAASTLAAVLAIGLSVRPQADEYADALSQEGPESPKASNNQQKKRGGRSRGHVNDRQAASGSAPAPAPKWGLAAILLTLSGFATLTYEIVWTRIFALTGGPSTYAFAGTLAVVIAGIAAGSVLGSSVATRVKSVSVVLGLTLILTAIVSAWAGWFAGSALPRHFAESLAAAPRTFMTLQWERTGVLAALVGPTAFGLGVAFPLALQLAGGEGDNVAIGVGRIYALNTLAAVAGSLATGFIAIPLFGLQTTLALATGILALSSIVAALFGTLPTRARAAITLVGVIVLVWLAIEPRWDRELLSSGVYKYAAEAAGSPDLEAALKAGTLVYYRDGAASTVSVKRLAGILSLSVDGKVDASSGGDMLTQKTLAHLPMLLHAGPRRICIIGLGSGVTLASALLHPSATVDVVEISPQVIEAAGLFSDDNHRALDDPRTHLILGDGRTHLTLSDQQYDVIISEPSNPWMAGVAALFTREFLTAIRARLAPNGILCQWAHTYNISDADLRSIVATFASVFPNGTMWLMGDGDLLLLGSNGADQLHLENIAANWDRPNVAADLRAAAAYEPFALLSSYIGGPSEIQRYGTGAALQSDDRMALEFSAPRALYGDAKENVATLRNLLDPRAAPPAISKAWADATAAEHRHRGEMMMKADAYEIAYQDYARALELDPNDPEAPDGLVRAAVAIRRERDAIGHLEAAARQRPHGVHVWIALSKMQAATGSLDRAVAAAREAVSVASLDSGALEQLASLYSDAGDAPNLDAVAQTLRNAFPNSRGAHYYTAASQFLHQDLPAAGRSIQLAITADPMFAPAHNLAGAIQATEGNVDAARTAFRAALSLDPRDAATYANFGVLELSHGHAPEAANLFAEALSIDPASPSARQGLADARRALGER
jgi:spermidine synthase